MHERLNPYRSPSASESFAPLRHPVISWVPLASVGVGALAYHGFALLLFTSAADQAIGALFLLNTPAIALWLYALWQKQRYAYIFGVICAGTQVVIHRLACGGFEISRAMMDATMINSVISMTMILLSWVCYKYSEEVE